jgi:hypothetical protein
MKPFAEGTAQLREPAMSKQEDDNEHDDEMA